MFRTLYTKLAAVLVVLFLVVGCLFILLMRYSTALYQQEVNQKLNQDIAEHIISENLLLQKGRVDQEALKNVFHMLMVVNPSVEIYLLDPVGKILAFSAPPEKVRRNKVDLEPIERFIGQRTFPILGDDPRNVDRQKVFSVAPIKVNGELHGYVYVVVGGEQHDSITSMLQGSYILKLTAGAAAAGVLFMLVAGLALFALMTRRLKRLTADVATFEQAGFTRPIERQDDFAGTGGDEVDRLAHTCYQMAARIVAQVDTLKQKDTLRRELVANVSHDLRTPLASLQGYLETLLLKEDTLTPEERRNYTKIAARHSKRLGKLVAELFELAKLDSNSTKPNCEPFPLPELVQDVVQKFELHVKQRGIRLETRCEVQAPFVAADIGLIERVLENLLENALRHTPAGGTVEVVLLPNDEGITVRVADTGCGIDAQDLPHIFERFYRPPRARRGAVGGAGLGLAIAKRILELHGSTIQAISEPNAGTIFSFQLPIYHTHAAS